MPDAASVSSICVVFDFSQKRPEPNWWKSAGVAEMFSHPAVSRIICLTADSPASVLTENNELPQAILVKSNSDLLACKSLLANHSVILWHDAASPLATSDFLDRLLRECGQHVDAVLPITTAIDTIKELDSAGFVRRTIPRNEIHHVQSPILLRKPAMDAVFVRLAARGDDATFHTVSRQVAEVVETDRLAIISLG